MNTKYNHYEVEKGKNTKWIQKRYFSDHDSSKKPFAILLPPPNVTGNLHLGHAWDSYIQDTVIRYKKLAGFDVLWIPGMDHAGIATQAKVEEKLHISLNKTKEAIGRTQFIEKVWQWKEEYATRIRNEWGKLGLAFDYNSERFTMDKGLSDAVSQVFINLYNRNLIYKSKQAVNFDVTLKTVLSNIEVVSKDVKQNFYYIKYDLEGGGTVSVATVRPETLFSDVALAVNPNDSRHKHLVGKFIIHPLLKNRQPIISDPNIEIGKGTGIMKVSAHSAIDIEIIMKHKLEINECIDENGKLNAKAMEFAGLDRILARSKIIKKLNLEKKLDKVEKKNSAVGFSQRSNSIIEIFVKPQWFVKMKPMAKYIFDDLKKNGVKFFPSRFQDQLQEWMKNVHDWCISRQLWWGHRIPAWYKNGEVKVQKQAPGTSWIQDEDVLDTWFSSGLAPFSFLGWPNDKEKLKRYYPINLLVSGYDIIFFWVARMYFQGLDIMKQKPFYEVFVHGLIRDAGGLKMSKSLGNGVEPTKVIDKYGSDALRWFLLTNSKSGQDIRYSEEKLRSAWGLNNKLWNIARYIIKIMDQKTAKISTADIWINNQLWKLKNYIDVRIKDYNFTVIGKRIHKFINEDLSSWYIEITKNNPNQKFAKQILQKTLIIIHPFLPFISDHIYKLIDGTELLETKTIKIEKIGETRKLNRIIKFIKNCENFGLNMKFLTKMKFSIELTLLLNLWT